MSRLSMLAAAMVALAASEVETVRTPEEADRHDLDRSAAARERIAEERARLNKERYDQAAKPFREARRARMAKRIQESKR
jgi:hypothetical protein